MIEHIGRISRLVARVAVIAATAGIQAVVLGHGSSQELAVGPAVHVGHEVDIGHQIVDGRDRIVAGHATEQQGRGFLAGIDGRVAGPHRTIAHMPGAHISIGHGAGGAGDGRHGQGRGCTQKKLLHHNPLDPGVPYPV